MDDYRLGLWVADQARKSGVTIHEDTHIQSVTSQGKLSGLSGKTIHYDRLINVAGPWTEKLATQSGCQLSCKLDLVRGSQIVVGQHCSQAPLLEVPKESRVFFVLPWKCNTLIGTTEQRQQLSDPTERSKDEIKYLLNAYNHYHVKKIEENDISESLAGLRPLVKPTNVSEKHSSKTPREYVVHKQQHLITVLGGNWTTALELSRRHARALVFRSISH